MPRVIKIQTRCQNTNLLYVKDRNFAVYSLSLVTKEQSVGSVSGQQVHQSGGMDLQGATESDQKEASHKVAALTKGTSGSKEEEAYKSQISRRGLTAS